MNKSIVTILAISALASLRARADDPVYSANVMGFQKVDVPAQGLSIAGAPYVRTSNDINEVIGQQMTPGLDLNSADVVYFFNASNQTYDIAYLYNDNGNFVWVDNASQNISTSPVPPGMGFWVRNNQSSNQNMYVSGEVITTPTYSTAVAPGLQILSYPYSYQVPLADLTLAGGAVLGGTVASADALYLWDQDAQRFKIFYYYLDGSLVEYGVGDTATNVLKPGAAFWYKHLGSGFTWVETNRYSIP